MPESSKRSHAYHRYLAYHETLEDLWSQGKGESEAADVLRDLMDPIWWAMTPEDHEAFKRRNDPVGRSDGPPPG